MEDCFIKGIEGKKVLVTGATGGIGSAIARIFGQHGAQVGIHYFNAEDKAKELADEINKMCGKGKAEIIKGDLLDHDARTGLVGSFAKIFGGIDILINNAGAVFDYELFTDLEEISWDKTFELNAKAPFYLSASAFKHMKKGGRIINISSANVKYGGSAKSMHYSSAKAALDNLTTGLSREGASKGILVNSIRCGVIDTDMRIKIKGYSEEQFRKRIDMIPL
ncbi:MAG: SDR family oxidoreductase, partial [Nanoarchaeota archaeon]|nr:SDR family oxidoreductase [Nanoarchaeota archaeon]